MWLLLGLVVMGGCRKAYLDVNLRGVALQVNFPDNFSTIPAANATVSFRNTNTGVQFTFTTDSEGRILVDSLLKGSYEVNAFRKVEPAEALQLVGIDAEIFLNAAIPNLSIGDNNVPEVLKLKGTLPGGLVFKEVFYTGSRTPAGGSYFSDQFYEIYNNSADTIYADSLCIANTGGTSGQSSTGRTWGFMSDPDHVYLQNVWMVPGTGRDHPIAPGESIIIAQDGINHQDDPLGNPSSPVNLGLGRADFETYVPRSDNRDLDSDVPNLTAIYLGSVGFDWLVPVFGPGMVIFRHSNVAALPLFVEPNNTSSAQYMQVPIDSVYDAVDFLANANAVNFKRIPVALDAGFKFCSGTYVGESVRRKVRTSINGRRVLQDFNNTTEDFEVATRPLVRW